MDLIRQIKAFGQITFKCKISARAQALYLQILTYFNVHFWPDNVPIPNSYLQQTTQLSRLALTRARDELINSGIISYARLKGKQTGIYNLPDLTQIEKTVLNSTASGSDSVVKEKCIKTNKSFEPKTVSKQTQVFFKNKKNCIRTDNDIVSKQTQDATGSPYNPLQEDINIIKQEKTQSNGKVINITMPKNSTATLKKDFLREFKQQFPKKAVDCSIPNALAPNLKMLINEITKQPFIANNARLTLRFCIAHAHDILTEKYKPYAPDKTTEPKFKQRKYDKEFIDNLYDNLDTVQLR